MKINKGDINIDFWHYVKCPGVIDDSVFSSMVMQHMEGDFYKWEEFNFGNNNYCIVLESPKEKRLSGKETKVLLEKSFACP